MKRYSTWANPAYDLVSRLYGERVAGTEPGGASVAPGGVWTTSFQYGAVPMGQAPSSGKL